MLVPVFPVIGFFAAGATIGSIYFVGLIVLYFARETKGQALPD